mmetsp:Transcript_73346/g.203312  ORF Transcript_73346/g.203312 Transcript_73346/m.203312 type:complete len:217 (+) Transcript_73346:85-735(+)
MSDGAGSSGHTWEDDWTEDPFKWHADAQLGAAPWGPSWAHAAELASMQAGDLFGMLPFTLGQVQSRMLLERTKLCKFHAQGRCRRGAACTFAHSPAELRPQPRLFRTQLCTSFVASGVCGFGERCRFAHSLEDVRPLGLEDSGDLADPEGEVYDAVKSSDRRVEALLEALRLKGGGLEKPLLGPPQLSEPGTAQEAPKATLHAAAARGDGGGEHVS